MTPSCLESTFWSTPDQSLRVPLQLNWDLLEYYVSVWGCESRSRLRRGEEREGEKGCRAMETKRDGEKDRERDRDRTRKQGEIEGRQ